MKQYNSHSTNGNDFSNHSPSFTVIEGNNQEIKSSANNYIKCFQSQLLDVKQITVSELFQGFQTIKAITFSYDIDFINELMTHFTYGEIIIGGNFLVQKDVKFQELFSEILANAYQAGMAIRNRDKLIHMLQKQEIEFRTPNYVLDHRKIYLLKADDGRTRVVKTSANMSKRAWNNDQMEHYDYDDTLECYEAYEKDFEIAWHESSPLPAGVVSAKHEDDLVEGNCILKNVKETGNTIILQDIKDDIIIPNVKYVIDHEKIQEEYKEILTGINTKSKKGVYELLPKTIEKIKFNQKKISKKKYKTEKIFKNYPTLQVDIDNQDILLNRTSMDLHPSDQEIRSDIEEILKIYNNFDEFVSDDKLNLKRTHFKLMNALLCSPFHASFRCNAKLKGISTSSLPMFTLISSETSNSGKTFMVRAAIKLMTGELVDIVKAVDYNKDKIKNTQVAMEGVPFFIDEIDNSYLSRIKDVIKNPEICEDQQLEQMPMLVFASNDVLKPAEPLRKRMLFFTIDGSLSSQIDKTAQEGKGKAILKKLGTGFYREYLRRILILMKKEMDYLIFNKEIPDDYYPDLMKLSSETIIQILADYGYEIPPFMNILTWATDYSCDSNADEAIQNIGQFCKNNKKSYTYDNKNIIIELGSDKYSKKRIESWANILPAEFKATIQPTKDSLMLIINRKELEKRLGYSLGKFPFHIRKK